MRDRLFLLPAVVQEIHQIEQYLASSGTHRSEGERLWSELLHRYSPDVIYQCAFLIKSRYLADISRIWIQQNQQVDLGPLPPELLPPTYTPEDIRLFPKRSWALQFAFLTASPYMSNGDPGGIAHQTIATERVFPFPALFASAWKGALRRVCAENDLCSPELREQGTLCFTSSFFQKKGVEVAAPHNTQGTLTNLLRLECVPKGAQSWFSAFYLGEEEGLKTSLSAVQVLTQALAFVCTEYGIGRQKKNGYGRISPSVAGTWVSAKGQVSYTHLQQADTIFSQIQEEGLI